MEEGTSSGEDITADYTSDNSENSCVSTPRCDFCDATYSDEAKYGCEQCEAFFCSACLRDYHGRGAFRNHTVVDASEMQHRSHVEMCVDHQEKLKLYCMSCEKPICLECKVLGSHMTHHVTDAQEGNTTVRSEIQSLLLDATRVSPFDEHTTQGAFSQALQTGVENLTDKLVRSCRRHEERVEQVVKHHCDRLGQLQEQLNQMREEEQNDVKDILQEALNSIIDGQWESVDFLQDNIKLHKRLKEILSAFEDSYQLRCSEVFPQLHIDVKLSTPEKHKRGIQDKQVGRSPVKEGDKEQKRILWKNLPRETGTAYKVTVIEDQSASSGRSVMHHITAMSQHCDKSCEEIRLADYLLGFSGECSVLEGDAELRSEENAVYKTQTQEKVGTNVKPPVNEEHKQNKHERQLFASNFDNNEFGITRESVFGNCQQITRGSSQNNSPVATQNITHDNAFGKNKNVGFTFGSTPTAFGVTPFSLNGQKESAGFNTNQNNKTAVFSNSKQNAPTFNSTGLFANFTKNNEQNTDMTAGFGGKTSRNSSFNFANSTTNASTFSQPSQFYQAPTAPNFGNNWGFGMYPPPTYPLAVPFYGGSYPCFGPGIWPPTAAYPPQGFNLQGSGFPHAPINTSTLSGNCYQNLQTNELGAQCWPPQPSFNGQASHSPIRSGIFGTAGTLQEKNISAKPSTFSMKTGSDSDENSTIFSHPMGHVFGSEKKQKQTEKLDSTPTSGIWVKPFMGNVSSFENTKAKEDGPSGRMFSGSPSEGFLFGGPPFPVNQRIKESDKIKCASFGSGVIASDQSPPKTQGSLFETPNINNNVSHGEISNSEHGERENTDTMLSNPSTANNPQSNSGTFRLGNSSCSENSSIRRYPEEKNKESFFVDSSITGESKSTSLFGVLGSASQTCKPGFLDVQSNNSASVSVSLSNTPPVSASSNRQYVDEQTDNKQTPENKLFCDEEFFNIPTECQFRNNEKNPNQISQSTIATGNDIAETSPARQQMSFGYNSSRFSFGTNTPAQGGNQFTNNEKSTHQNASTSATGNDLADTSPARQQMAFGSNSSGFSFGTNVPVQGGSQSRNNEKSTNQNASTSAAGNDLADTSPARQHMSFGSNSSGFSFGTHAPVQGGNQFIQNHETGCGLATEHTILNHSHSSPLSTGFGTITSDSFESSASVRFGVDQNHNAEEMNSESTDFETSPNHALLSSPVKSFKAKENSPLASKIHKDC